MRLVATKMLLVVVGAAACTPNDSKTLAVEQCNNGRDDDGNGLIDCADPRCVVDSACLGSTVCGNAIREGFEFCDGVDLAGQTCGTQGFLANAGELGCQSDCAGFDTRRCIRKDLCGNDRREGGEECDGTDFGTETCRGRGFAEGQLDCDDACQIDVGQCVGVNLCGNGVLDAGETCDSAELNGATCESLGLRGAGLRCNRECQLDSSDCEIELCGNQRLDPGETCDGLLFADGIGCVSEGFVSGIASCNSTCDGVETNGCTMCGNNQIDPGETCDGTAVGVRDCALEGFATGSLRCNDTCDAFDTTSCSNCGNGIIDAGEDCEDGLPLTSSCFDLGYRDTPGLGCTQCRFDTTECSGFSECGNGVLDGFDAHPGATADSRLYQEFCDPGSPFFVVPSVLVRIPRAGACAAFGGAGDVGCTEECTLDFSPCFGPGNGDFCAGSNWYGDGTVCDPCDRISGIPDPDCFSIPSTCLGDGPDGEINFASSPPNRPPPNYQSADFESCDGNDEMGLRGQTCASLGFAGGTLSCRRDCNFNTSQCISTTCGDDLVQGREACDFGLDGLVPRESIDCSELGQGTGTATCTDACLTFDDTGCSG